MGSSQPREGQASPRLRLSTRALPERDRFEVFREKFSQYLYRADVTNRAEGTFEGSIDLLKAGSVGISRITALPSVYTRSRRHASDSDEALTLFVGLTHGVTIQQAGVLHEFRPGNGFLYHGSSQAEARLSHRSEFGASKCRLAVSKAAWFRGAT